MCVLLYYFFRWYLRCEIRKIAKERHPVPKYVIICSTLALDISTAGGGGDGRGGIAFIYIYFFLWQPWQIKIVSYWGSTRGPFIQAVKRKGTVVFCRVPDVVVYPASQEQVETLVQLAKEMNTVIIPFGGGAFPQDHGSQRRKSARLSLQSSELASRWGERGRGANSEEGTDPLVHIIHLRHGWNIYLL